MKIKRYNSHDLRSAVLAAKNELGSNVVIVSHQNTSNGVEVTAAIDEEFIFGSNDPSYPMRKLEHQVPVKNHHTFSQQSRSTKKTTYFNNEKENSFDWKNYLYL